jgi:anti-sigma factor RsiW
MKTTLSSRDWQALSDYLDGQLNPQERARLESRLKVNASLRRAFEELRRTRIILRNAPRLRAPRRFTLTPAMIAKQSPQRSFWQPFTVLRLSSVLAALLLIVVFLGDYLSGGNQAARVAFAPNSTAQRQALKAVPTNESLADQANQSTAPTQAPAAAAAPVAKALEGPLTTGTPLAMPPLAASQPYPLRPSMAAGLAPSTTVTESLMSAALPPVAYWR